MKFKNNNKNIEWIITILEDEKTPHCLCSYKINGFYNGIPVSENTNTLSFNNDFNIEHYTSLIIISNFIKNNTPQNVLTIQTPQENLALFLNDPKKTNDLFWDKPYKIYKNFLNEKQIETKIVTTTPLIKKLNTLNNLSKSFPQNIKDYISIHF